MALFLSVKAELEIDDATLQRAAGALADIAKFRLARDKRSVVQWLKVTCVRVRRVLS